MHPTAAIDYKVVSKKGARQCESWLNNIMHATCAGVHASADGAEVATSVSLTEWFLNFYAAAHQGLVQPVEGVVRAGEVLFIPRGWWHMAMNLEVSSVSSWSTHQCCHFGYNLLCSTLIVMVELSALPLFIALHCNHQWQGTPSP